MKSQVKMLMLFCVMFCFGLAMADTTILFGPDMSQLPPGQYQLVTVKADGSSPSNSLFKVGGEVGPVVGPVVDPVDPTVTLDVAVGKAIDAVVEYPDKSINLKQLAFGIGLAMPNIPKDDMPIADNNVDTMKQLFAVVLGTNNARWQPFWTVMENRLLACQTNKQLHAAYVTMQAVITARLPDGAEGDDVEAWDGHPTYGLQREGANGEWLKWLVANLPEIMKIVMMFITLSS